MDKFFLIDKPLWISSFDVIRQLRKKFNIRKMWHTWTLDPLATWWILIATWNYTKLIPYFEKDTKVYEFIIRLDWKTESFDLGTEVQYLEKEKLEKYKKQITREKIQKILKEKFTWEISQLPPKYSALKIWWQKAVDLIRKWEDVVLKKRTIFIDFIEILNFSFPEIKLKAKVSSWTYIRSIASDLWEILWTWWYVTKLRRVEIWNLEQLLFQNLENITKDNYLDVKFLFPKQCYISLGSDILKNLDNWLPFYWIFDYPIDRELFVFNWKYITNIVLYNWEKLIPKRKIV